MTMASIGITHKIETTNVHKSEKLYLLSSLVICNKRVALGRYLNFLGFSFPIDKIISYHE